MFLNGKAAAASDAVANAGRNSKTTCEKQGLKWKQGFKKACKEIGEVSLLEHIFCTKWEKGSTQL